MKFLMPAAALVACLPHVATGESRHRLLGVHIEPHGSGGIAVASDGTTLCVARWDAPARDADDPAAVPSTPAREVTLAFPKAAVGALKKAARRAFDFQNRVLIEVDDAAGRATLTVLTVMWKRNEQAVFGLSLAADFPDWRPMFPAPGAEPSAIPTIALNPKKLAKFAPLSTRGAMGLKLDFHGETKVIVVRGDNPDMIGLLMPVNLKWAFEAWKGVGEWWRERAPTETEWPGGTVAGVPAFNAANIAHVEKQFTEGEPSPHPLAVTVEP